MADAASVKMMPRHRAVIKASVVSVAMGFHGGFAPTLKGRSGNGVAGSLQGGDASAPATLLAEQALLRFPSRPSATAARRQNPRGATGHLQHATASFPSTVVFEDAHAHFSTLDCGNHRWKLRHSRRREDGFCFGGLIFSRRDVLAGD